MPDETMASAICRINVSLILHPNVFQLFHPIGGVRATPFSRAWAEGVDRAKAAPAANSEPIVNPAATSRRRVQEFMWIPPCEGAKPGAHAAARPHARTEGYAVSGIPRP